MAPHLKQEKILKKKGFKVVAGVDEAGRGPLAGPVVVAAVILPIRFTVQGIDDSKKIKKNLLKGLFEKIIKKVDYGIGIVDEKVIDKRNILQATFLAMNQAVGNLKQKPQHVLFDGNRYNYTLSLPQTLLIKGDSISKSIAAASIIAKVTRDEIMEKYHEKYPQYGFKDHKGYATKNHIAALREHGSCPIHRKKFVNTALTEELELPLVI